MSTSDRLLDTRFAKWLVIVNGLVPAALLMWDAYRGQLGVNNVNFAIRTTGLVGLVFITLSLVVTPLRTLTGWNRLIAIRRNLGVLGFAYLAAHFLIFFWWDRMGSVSSTATEIVMRRYLWFGAGALVLMIPLTVTSTDNMVSRLGPVNWKRLHRLAYVIAIGAVIHYYLLVKSDTRQPLAFAGVIGVLLLYRVIKSQIDLRAEVRAARARKMQTACRTIAATRRRSARRGITRKKWSRRAAPPSTVWPWRMRFDSGVWKRARSRPSLRGRKSARPPMTRLRRLSRLGSTATRNRQVFLSRGERCMKRPREATSDGELTIAMEGGLRRVAPYWFK